MALPEDYAWSDELLQDAACVTVVRGQSVRHVLSAFGADPDVEVPIADAYGTGREAFVSVFEADDAVVAVEYNGFQGSMPHVLAAASSGSAIAASMFWNVNDDNAFTCARDGEIVATFDMYDAEWDRDVALPTELESLFRLAAESEDLHAIGLAMVEQFVGAGFTREDIDAIRFAHPVNAQPKPPEPGAQTPEREVLAACGAIGQDLDGAPGARALSGARGDLRVEATVRGQQKKYFKLLANFFGWWGAFSPGDLGVGNSFWLNQHARRGEHDILGRGGSVECTWLTINPPDAVTMTWNWLRPMADRSDAADTAGRLLAPPSQLSFELTLANDRDVTPFTTIAVRHKMVPFEWIEDLRVFWIFKLGEAERVYALNYRD